MVARIKALCSEQQISLNDLEVAVGLGVNTIYKWDGSSPAAEKLQKVADYFEVSVDYLMGRDGVIDEEMMALRERLRRQPGMRTLFYAVDGATTEQLEAVAEMVRVWKG